MRDERQGSGALSKSKKHFVVECKKLEASKAAQCLSSESESERWMEGRLLTVEDLVVVRCH